MKLKEEFVIHKVGEKYIAVATGEAAKELNGMIRCNEIANTILTLLKKETTEEQVVSAIMEEYEGEADVIRCEVHKVIEQLREEHLLEA